MDSSSSISFQLSSDESSSSAPRYLALCLIRLEISNGNIIFVACPSDICLRASSDKTVIAFLSSGLEPKERILNACASPWDWSIFDFLSPSARRILLCLSPSASRIIDCLFPSAVRIADLFSPSAFKIAARLNLSAAVCSVIACFTEPTGSTSFISTRSTFTPHWSVSRSRISLSLLFISSRL